MNQNHGDMYEYILESREAAQHIVEYQEEIFKNVEEYMQKHTYKQLYVIGSGTSYHAALAAKPFMEKVLGIKVFVSYPILFKDEIIFEKDTLVIGISHAGKSASTIQGLRKARKQGFPTIAMSAEKDTPIYENADTGLEIAIGLETAGPKTKGFIGSIVTLMLFAMRQGLQTGKIDKETFTSYTKRMLENTDQIPAIAEAATLWYEKNKEEWKSCRRLYIIGYDHCLAAMMEGTLKILEAVRYSVQGYELEEFMHGIYHAIDSDTYMLYIGAAGQYYERIQRLQNYFATERTNHNFMITSQNTKNPKDMVYPFTDDPDFAVLQYIIPMQVLARKLSLDLGIDCNIPSDPLFHKKMASYIYNE